MINEILTCAYTNRPLPPIKITPGKNTITFKNFAMYDDKTLNCVVYTGKKTTVCLVVKHENRVWYWSNGYHYNHQNFIYRVMFPALANFVYTSWVEKRHRKYLKNLKSFTSHLAFSPNNPFENPQKSTSEMLDLCCSLWDGPDEENLTNWEMDLVKPWLTRQQDFKIYKQLIEANKHQFHNIMDEVRFTGMSWNDFYKNIIDVNPFFVDLPWKLYIIAIENHNERMIQILQDKWPTVFTGHRLKEINALLL